LLLSDHIDGQYAIGPALGAAASLTTRLHLGSLVYCNDFYHPVLLAREAATLDQISGGRFQLDTGTASAGSAEHPDRRWRSQDLANGRRISRHRASEPANELRRRGGIDVFRSE